MGRFSIILAVFLAGCAGEAKIKAEPQFRRIHCKQYTVAQMRAAAEELRAKGIEITNVGTLVDDYRNLRKAVCKGLAK